MLDCRLKLIKEIHPLELLSFKLKVYLYCHFMSFSVINSFEVRFHGHRLPLKVNLCFTNVFPVEGKVNLFHVRVSVPGITSFTHLKIPKYLRSRCYGVDVRGEKARH